MGDIVRELDFGQSLDLPVVFVFTLRRAYWNLLGSSGPFLCIERYLNCRH